MPDQCVGDLRRQPCAPIFRQQRVAELQFVIAEFCTMVQSAIADKTSIAAQLNDARPEPELPPMFGMTLQARSDLLGRLRPAQCGRNQIIAVQGLVARNVRRYGPAERQPGAFKRCRTHTIWRQTPDPRAPGRLRRPACLRQHQRAAGQTATATTGGASSPSPRTEDGQHHGNRCTQPHQRNVALDPGECLVIGRKNRGIIAQ